MISNNLLIIIFVVLGFGFVCSLIYLLTRHKGCKYCHSEENFGGNGSVKFRIEPAGRGFVITSEVYTGDDLQGYPAHAYGESEQIHHCPMCGRFLG